MKKFLNTYGVYIGVALLLVAGVVIYSANRGGAVKLPDKAFFVDEETGEETVRPITDIPPLQGKSGKDSVVRAYKYSCDGGSTSKVAYYFKYTPETQAKLKSTPAASLSQFDSSSGELVRLPEKGSPWVPFKSQAAQSVVTNIDCPKGQEISTLVPQ